MFDKLSATTLQHFQRMQGSVLQDVVHHFWFNTADAGRPISFLEWVELVTAGGERYFISHHEEEGIKADQWDIDLKRFEIMEQFGGKIALVPENASGHEVWSRFIGKEITHLHIKMDPGIPGCISSVNIEFDEEAAELSAAAEGLLVKKTLA